MSDAFNGMNGTIMLNVSDTPGITVGYVSGMEYGYGYERLRVTVELRLERLERRESYETIQHETVSKPLDFAITTAVWNPSNTDWVSGGATVEPLRHLIEYAHDWDADKVRQLASLEKWHLNTMRAGCAHQSVVMEESSYGMRPSLDLTKPCPITGYRYGSAWLVEPLPEDFVPNLLALLDEAIIDRRVYVNPELTKHA